MLRAATFRAASGLKVREIAGARVAGGLALEALSAEQRGLWDRVSELWEQSRRRDRTLIGAGIHPQYVGWDMSTERPHDKNGAIASVTAA